jgi:hypothetical protein
MLRSALDQSRLIRLSPDLTRVKVTRKDPKTGKANEWVMRSPSRWNGVRVGLPGSS